MKKRRQGEAAAVNDELRRDIAAMLIAGDDVDRVAQRVASRGVAYALARAEVERAAKSPYLAAGRAATERLARRVAKRDWLLGNYARLVAAPDHGAVDRVDRMPADRFLADHYRAHRPVVLTGLVDHWPALRRWSLDDLAARLGGVDVRVQWNRDADPDYERNSDAHGALRPFAEVIERLRASAALPTNDFYVTANNHEHNRRALAPLYDDAGDIPGYLAAPGGKSGFIWIGPRGTITPWHHDLTNNLLLQVVGRKRVRLVASHHGARMKNSRHCFSDWAGERLEAGPGDDERPPVMIAGIGPGEALFLPVGWWHHVEGLDVTIGMSFTNFAWNNDFWSHYASYGEL
jgi:hypothetical protein